MKNTGDFKKSAPIKKRMYHPPVLHELRVNKTKGGINAPPERGNHRPS